LGKRMFGKSHPHISRCHTNMSIGLRLLARTKTQRLEV
jgi:hypothetical protein